MKFFRTVLILVLTITLPISQARAVVPDPHSALSDAVESSEENQEINISAPEGDAEPAQIPMGDLFQVETIISGNTAEESSIEMHDEQDLLEVPVLAEDDQQFWTTKKIVVSSTILITTGLLIGLLLLMSGGGDGSGFASLFGFGGFFSGKGNKNNNNGDGDNGGAPHNPEPSTFLLMGLGLLVPVLRKRFSL